jgi:hypothetical protein
MRTRSLASLLAAFLLTLLLAACGGGGSSSSACTPSDAGLTCAAPTPGVSTATTPLAVQHFASVRVGTSVAFNVPPNTASLTIVEQAVDAPDYVTVDNSPLDNVAVPAEVVVAGTPLYDDATDDGSFSGAPTDPTQIEDLPAFFFTDSPGTGTLTIPNTTGALTSLAKASGLPSGQGSLTVSDYAYQCSNIQDCCGGSTTSLYDVTVITKPLTSGAIPVAGTLDMTIYFVATEAGGTALSAAAATSGNDTDINRMVFTIRYILNNAGISLGTVTFAEVPSNVQTTYATGVDASTTGACGPLAELLQNSNAGSTMNIFLVPTISGSGIRPGDSLVGVDGTIPGPATIAGTVASGAIVSVADLRANEASCTGTPVFDANSRACGADVTAYVVSHETGHFLGLYHVTEADGAEFDPLSGTARCECTSCAPAASQSKCGNPSAPSATDYEMQVSDCTAVAADASSGCGGGQDLMFWLLGPGAEGVLTAEQQEVIRANPLVH